MAAVAISARKGFVCQHLILGPFVLRVALIDLIKIQFSSPLEKFEDATRVQSPQRSQQEPPFSLRSVAPCQLSDATDRGVAGAA